MPKRFLDVSGQFGSLDCDAPLPLNELQPDPLSANSSKRYLANVPSSTSTSSYVLLS